MTFNINITGSVYIHSTQNNSPQGLNQINPFTSTEDISRPNAMSGRVHSALKGLITNTTYIYYTPYRNGQYKQS